MSAGPGALPGARDRAYALIVCGSAHAIRIEDLSPRAKAAGQTAITKPPASVVKGNISRAPLRRGLLHYPLTPS